MNHQLSSSKFAIIKFVNQSINICCITICMARSIVLWNLKWVDFNSQLNRLLEDTTSTRRCGEV